MSAHQAPPSLGFSRQEHWSGLPLPSPMHESEKWKWSCSVVLGLMVVLFLAFKEISIPSSIVTVSIYIPNNSTRAFPFSTPSPALIVCRHSYDGHSLLYKVISHCGFDLHFSNNERCWAPFHVFASHLYVFFGEMSVSVFLIGFLWHWVGWAACIFWKLILCQLFHLPLFSPILRVVFSPCL